MRPFSHEQSDKLVIASRVSPERFVQRNILLLAESLRAFGGVYSQTPFWCFSFGDEAPLADNIKERLLALGVRLLPVTGDRAPPEFPFMRKAFAAAHAEQMTSGQVDWLVWIDSDTVVLHEPTHFQLEAGKSLGYRPVHHTLIGSRYDAPLDPFWQRIYAACGVPDTHIYPIVTHIDETRIRPYFHAGMLMTRPTTRLFQRWRDTFLHLYAAPSFQELYARDERYAVFMHQAVLTGVILARSKPSALQELPPTYNYPLHLFAEDVSASRPQTLEDLVTFRHERYLDDSEWPPKIPARAPLKQWIAARLLS